MLFLLWVCMYGSLVGALYVPCSEITASSYTGPPLPTLPDQYHASVEANIVQKNYTTTFREYYDYKNNKFTSEWYLGQNGISVRTVARPDRNETYLMYPNKTCHVNHINTLNPGFFWFVSGKNGTHVKSLKDLLSFGSEYGEKYVSGKETIRGIPVDHWQSCLKLADSEGNFTLDFYFTRNTSYTIDGQNVRKPVRAVLKGHGGQSVRLPVRSSLEGKGYTTQMNSTSTHTFHHYYEFFDFHVGPILDQSVFEIPPDVYCNRSRVLKPLPTPYVQFTSGIETITHSNTKPEGVLNIVVDQISKIVRLEVDRALRPEDTLSFGEKPLIYISDEHSGLLYIIEKFKRNCTVIESGRGIPDFSSSRFSSFFEKDYEYQGQKTFRGLDVDSWAYFNHQKGNIMELLFLKRNHENEYLKTITAVNLSNGSHQLSERNFFQLVGIVEVKQISNIQARTEDTIHFYGISPGYPSADVFDISTCFSSENPFLHLTFQLEGNDRGKTGFVGKIFVATLINVLAQEAAVSVTRVSSLTFSMDGSFNDERILVFFKLMDNKIDGIRNEKVGPSLSMAKLNFEGALDVEFNFTVNYPTKQEVYRAVHGSLKEMLTPDQTAGSMDVSSKSYSAGAMAGLGLGMVALGVIIGLLGAFIVYTRNGASVPYQIGL